MYAVYIHWNGRTQALPARHRPGWASRRTAKHWSGVAGILCKSGIPVRSGSLSRLTTLPGFGYNALTVAQTHSTVATLDLLWELLKLDSPSGDEGAFADWLMDWTQRELPDVRLERIGDSVIALRGERPAVALFAHTDTTGWTLGYHKRLIRIGGPDGRLSDSIRPAGMPNTGNTLARRKDGTWRVKGKTDAPPGSRWVYAAEPQQDDDVITSPYLDNRAGVWAALQALTRCPRIAAAFTVGEEHSGKGAAVCARRLAEAHGITQALIADITWHTKHIRCGHGPAISLRDAYVPRRRYLDRVLSIAEEWGQPVQREIESEGSSDGGFIERSGAPIDWVFVGAPEKRPHTASESIHSADLHGMANLLTHLVNGLSAG